jgi:very-short-patch-repair endonuclease
MILRSSQLWGQFPRREHRPAAPPRRSEQEIAEILQTPWSDILRSDGWVEVARRAECGCPTWTVPGSFSSPVLATAHEPGCSAFNWDRAGILHVHSGTPPRSVGKAMRIYGGTLFSKIQIIDQRRGWGRDAIPAHLAEQLESEAERRFWSAYMRLQPPVLAGLIPQRWIRRHRVDFAIPSLKIAIEVDGYKWHSDRQTFTRDRQRQREIELLDGWRFIRFSGKETCDSPDACVRETADLVDRYRREH